MNEEFGYSMDDSKGVEGPLCTDGLCVGGHTSIIPARKIEHSTSEGEGRDGSLHEDVVGFLGG